MYLFWIVIILLTLVALAFLLKPLLFVKEKSFASSTENLKSEPAYLIAFVLFILLPTSALIMYLHWGNSKAMAEWRTTQKNAEQVKKEIARLGSRQNIILTLRHKLQQLPEDESSAKGWYLLGKLYFNEKDMRQSIACFQKAVRLQPNEPDFMLELVSVKFYVNHELSDEDKNLIYKLLTLSPNNVNAINLLALDAYQRKNYSQAIHHWESLLKYFPIASEDSKTLLSMIHQAQEQLPQQDNATAKLVVTVSLSKQFETKLQSTDSLFIYALEAGGPKIPLAAVRLKASQLPVTITLDDSKSMIPGRSLANAEKITVEARISKSGNALPTKGDLIGSSDILDMKAQNRSVAITIDSSLRSQ